jgi:hypothetical protein
VKAKEKLARSGPDKQKKQLMILGGLVAALGVVVAIQFGGKDGDAEAAQTGDAAATAQTLATDPAAAAAAAGLPAPATAAAPAPVAPIKVEDNSVLSAPVEAEGLLRSPFASFWNVASAGTKTPAGGGVPEIAPPAITLNATMPSPQRGLAVIDGEMHTVGDIIQGWELAEVLERRIVLRSPSKATVTVDMPLLTGSNGTTAGRSDG